MGVLSSPTSIELDPDDPGCFQLKASYENRQRVAPLIRTSGMRGGSAGLPKTIAEVKQEDLNLGMMPPPGAPMDPNVRSVHRHSIVATITGAPTDRLPCYPACPVLVESRIPSSTQPGGDTPAQRPCQKKCTDESGMWRCNFGHTCAEPCWRYIARFNVMDCTDTLEVNTFDEVGKKLYGCDANEFKHAFESEGGPDEINRRVLWRKVSLRLRSNKETWQDVERTRVQADDVGPVDYRSHARTLLAEVNASLGMK